MPYSAVFLDLGTGEGRSVVRAARRPDVLFIGLDADPSRMRRAARHAPANAVSVAAAAEALPLELEGALSGVCPANSRGARTLHGLVDPSPAVLGGLARALRPGGSLTARPSFTARDGGEPLGQRSIDRAAYARCGVAVTTWRPATALEIAASASSWAKERPVWLLHAMLTGSRAER